MTAVPVVSVVVSTYNRSHLLARLTESVAAQRGVGPFELVIVDDCSTDDTDAVLTELAEKSSIPVRALRTPRNGGPARGRNLGWRSAAAPLIAFTDDDCTPEPDWLANLVAELGRAEVVQGKTLPNEAQAAGRGPFARVVWIESWSDQFETCNMGYRRDVLERLGGFDESFTRPFGEDVDLGWRAVEAGASTAWSDGAVVRHDVEHNGRLRDFADTVKDTRRKVYAVLMVKRHPRLRDRLLFRRVFYRDSHPPAIAALGGVALLLTRPRSARTTALALLCCLPYVAFRAFVKPSIAQRRNYPVVIPMQLAVDAAEVAVMVVGSVRFRCVVL